MTFLGFDHIKWSNGKNIVKYCALFCSYYVQMDPRSTIQTQYRMDNASTIQTMFHPPLGVGRGVDEDDDDDMGMGGGGAGRVGK